MGSLSLTRASGRSSLPGLATVRVASRELFACARHAWLMRHDVLAPVLPRDAADGANVVVCLHGVMATAGVLRPLRLRLARSAHTATLSFPLGPGVAALAERLGDALALLHQDVRLHLVGHSLGGIVARYYAEHHGDARVVQTISLASPFAGVPNARLLGLPFARDIDPGSAILRALGRSSLAPGSLPHLSIVAANDALVPGAEAQALPGWEVRVVGECGHNTLLYHEGVMHWVEARVRELAHAAPAPAPQALLRSA
ncbi:MAG: hypothetical protein HY908_36895 [Myxococcales bacterium]|nr:hypothetical protein [Myxococcales bacterium]